MNTNNQIGINTEAYKKLKGFCKTHKYTSLGAINIYLSELGFSYSSETIMKYLQQLKKEKIIYSAGRGYYSTIKNEFTIDSKEYQPLIAQIKNKYPLLEFSLWSTKMLASAFHHTQNIFYIFIYADSDSLIFLRDFLLNNDFHLYLNPSKNDKNIFLKNNTIILRPGITRSKSKEMISSIEKILVDFYLECEKLNIVDLSEYKKVFTNLFSIYRINISSLLDYAERRKIDKEIKNIILKYANATLF